MDRVFCQAENAMISSYHEPVLTAEVLKQLNIIPGKFYIDGTLGGAGHTVEILKRGGIVLGIDTDADALAFVQEKFEILNSKFKKNLRLVQGNFRNIEEIAKREGFTQVDGVLLDLGVSSHQLDTPARGFSYRFADSPLDLRLHQEGGDTAAELVQSISEQEAYEIFATFGEEERAGAISAALVRARSIRPIQTVGDMIAVVERSGVGKGELLSVLSRVFQALRIAVNDELTVLKEAVRGAKAVLVPGGRLAIISFHSLEDRIVKRMMRESGWKVITTKPIVPTEEEIFRNRRARSAKLRVAQTI
jgi:16S rRNA (cytosine1402-N4)-methyltransferase